MLSIAPGKVRAGRRRVLLVGGIGGAVPSLRRHAEGLRNQGCAIEEWTPGPAESPDHLANVLDVPAADASERVRRALEAHCRDGRVDEVVFGGLGGPGFRAIQAKRAGLAFSGVQLSVVLDEDSIRLRQEAAKLPGAADLEREYAERYAFEYADERVCTDAALLDAVARRGWLAPGASEAARPPAAADETRPLVTVCVAHYNHGAYLPEALDALATQTYSNLEVLVIDDGSTDAASREVFDRMEGRHRHFRFLRQQNSGIGATRNRGLREARGEFFIPVDADNVSRPDMVERFAAALAGRPEAAALSCYFRAFASSAGLAAGKFLYACRPTAGPHVLACLQNVYGDANAIFRAGAFRSVGGFETDRGTSYEDWEAFVKLAHAGHKIDVVPEYLFFYRHLATGFSRTTNAAANRLRVLRQFVRLEWLPAEDRESLWLLLAGQHHSLAELEARQRSRRYRAADWLAGRLGWARRLLGAGRDQVSADRGG